MSENKNRKSRVAAVALAIVGVAGISMAAAAQLNLSYSGSFQAGATQTIDADCQGSEAIAVKFAAPTFEASTSGAPWKVAKVNFDGIATKCQGKSYEAAYKLSTGDWVKLEAGSVAASSLAVSLPTGVNANDIKNVALTIFG